jgi:hydrogenase nickel incorporation protein HypA/HybF
MHELTLATSLVAMADHHAATHGARRVSRINVRLGELCGIAHALYFCFEPAARGTRCEGAKLHIAEVPLTAVCEVCGETKRPNSRFNLRCPDCGRTIRTVLTGREMELVSIELDAEPDGRASTPSERASRGPVV